MHSITAQLILLSFKIIRLSGSPLNMLQLGYKEPRQPLIALFVKAEITCSTDLGRKHLLVDVNLDENY